MLEKDAGAVGPLQRVLAETKERLADMEKEQATLSQADAALEERVASSNRTEAARLNEIRALRTALAAARADAMAEATRVRDLQRRA